jgi:hypothetical protein
MSENKKETPLKTVAQQLKYNTIDNKSQLQYDDRGYIGKKSTPHKGGLANPKIKKEGYNTMSKFIDFVQEKDAASFKDAVENSISSKLHDTLESLKKEIASNFFNGQEEVVTEEALEEGHTMHTHTVHFADPKSGDWKGKMLINCDNDNEAVEHAHELAKKHGHKVMKVSKNQVVMSDKLKEEIEQMDEAGTKLPHVTKWPAAKKGAKLPGKSMTKEEAEQVDERALSSSEEEKKEKYVKGMKKSVAGFRARYGKRAKDVMYATATKIAKE